MERGSADEGCTGMKGGARGHTASSSYSIQHKSCESRSGENDRSLPDILAACGTGPWTHTDRLIDWFYYICALPTWIYSPRRQKTRLRKGVFHHNLIHSSSRKNYTSVIAVRTPKRKTSLPLRFPELTYKTSVLRSGLKPAGVCRTRGNVPELCEYSDLSFLLHTVLYWRYILY